jgi:uncharacterized protein with HEPN domain
VNEAKTPKMGYEGKGAEAQARLGDCLWDAHSAGGKIVEFTSGRSLAEYEESELLQSLVEKMLEIMAEALVEMRRHFPEEFARLDGGLRVIEVKASGAEAWRVAQEVVPEMVVQLQTMLDEWHQA